MRSSRPDVGTLEVLHSFAEAERRDLEEAWRLSPNERMALLERLRQEWYGKAETKSKSEFPGTLEVTKCP
jgi:hypothetical protein